VRLKTGAEYLIHPNNIHGAPSFSPYQSWDIARPSPFRPYVDTPARP
jgi:hypothetical protein